MTVTDHTPITATTAERQPRGKRLRAIGGWVAVATLAAVGAFIAGQVDFSPPSSLDALDPESVRDSGAMAVVEILREQGVEVSVHRSRADARAAVDDDTTLVMANPYTLTDDGLDALLEPAERIVFLSTGTHLLNHLSIGAGAAGQSSAVSADCSFPEFAEVGSIHPDRMFAPADGVDGCFGTDEAAAVLIDDRDGVRTSVIDGTRLFSNAHLSEDGNAALALALLGQSSKVVWYVPSYGDTDIEAQQQDTLGSLTPPWVTPAILLLLLAGIAAAFWRGRRFGPLVAETLPVTVRASETMQGRAKLTAKAADAAHAADALRDGSRRRLARRLGLAVTANADEVADAAADRLRIPRGSLQELLDGPLPQVDAELITFARRLSDLEAAVEGSVPTGRRPE